MKKRCLSPSSKDYHLYGDRGITVCAEWKSDYGTFQSWALSHGYADGLLLDRRDNDGDYCPDNCRWVDDFVQANNRRDNRYIEYRGKTYSMSDLSRIAVVSYTTLRTRLNLGWVVEDAVNTPAIKGRNQHGVAL